MAFSLLIGGAPYNWKQGTLNIVETLGGRSTCEFSIDNPDGSITAPQVGQSVLVKDGAYTIFAGSIETVEAVRYPGTFAGLWRVSCVDHHRILDRRVTGQKSWQSTRAGDIVTEICTTYLGGEAVGIDFIQQGPVVERFEIDHATIAEALQQLAEVAGMVWYIDYGRQLRFFAPNAYACPFELEPASTNFEDLVLRSTREQYANRIIAKIGQFVRDPQTARFDAQGRSGDGEEPLDWMKPDGSRKRWAVTYPVHAAPTVKVNGAARTVGTYGDDAAEFYWQTGSREIGQSDSSAALDPGDVLEITYVGLSSEVLTVENSGEISRRAAVEQHTGIYEKLVDTSQEMTRADARQYAQAALDKLDSLSAVAVIDTNTIIEPLASTARVGQFIHVDVDGYRLEWKQVTAVEYGAPSIITVPGHGLMDGSRIRLHQVPSLNGSWSVEVVDQDRLRLVGSSASGTYAGGGYAYPLTYLIRQIRTADVAGQLAVQLECVMGPATDDAASFFRDLAAAQGIPPSAPRPDKATADLPAVQNLTAEHSLDVDRQVVRVTLSCLTPMLAELSGLRAYVEIPQENDPDIEHPTMPGQVFFAGPQFATPGQNTTMDLSLPFPPASWLESKKVPNQPVRLTWVFYVLTESWDACAPLKRLDSLDPASPTDASPWVAITMDFTDWLAQESLAYVHPAIVPEYTTMEMAGGQVRIRAGWHPVFPSVSVSGVSCFTSTAADQQNRPHGYFPYEAAPEAPLPLNLGWVEARIDTPAELPARVALQIAARYSDGYEHSPVKMLWDQDGNPLTVPSPHGIALTITAESLSLAAPSITAASVEYRQTEAGWSYRFAVTLAGDVLAQPQYGGADVYVRFEDEPEPPDPSGWSQFRLIAQHRPGDSTTVYSQWWPITPGTSIQFWLRPLARDRSGMVRAWGDVAGPYSLALPIGDSIPGAGHTWNFTAQLNGYWDDGNGVRLGRVDCSWTPLSQPGVVYGIYGARATTQTPPPLTSFAPIANTAENSVTLWERPPADGPEYLHLALVVQRPSDGLWPKPADYPSGQLPLACILLPVAGLSDQVTNWSVTVETDQSQDIPRGRFVFSFTPPSDPDFHHVHVYRRPANAQGNPIADWLPDKVASIITGGPGGWWPLPSAAEYWLFKAVACNSLGQENTDNPPTVLVAVPVSSGVTMSKAKPGGVTGPIAVDGQGRITTASDRDVPVIAASQPGSTWLGSRVVYWAGQIWTWTGSAYQPDTNAAQIKAQLQSNGLTAAEFAAGYAPVRLVSSVPSSYAGDFIVNTTDRKLYRWNGSSYVRPMPGSDIKLELELDKLTAAQIAAGAVTTTQLAGNEIQVGPVSGLPPRFVVKDSGGATIGAIGEWSGFSGLWAANGRFGGSFSSPIIELTSAGGLIKNASFEIVAGGTKYVYINPTVGVKVVSSSTEIAELRGDALVISTISAISGSLRPGELRLYNGAVELVALPNPRLTLPSGAYISIGGSVIVDTSRVADVAGLKLNGTTVIDSSRNGTLATLNVGGATVIDTNRYASFQRLTVGGKLWFDETGKIRFWDIQNESIFLGGITITKWVPAYYADGSFAGKIPLI